MAIELHHACAKTVTHSDPQGLVPSTATATLYGPDGTVLQSPSVVIDDFTSAIAAGSTRNVLVLTSVAGAVVGRRYRVLSYGVGYVVAMATVDGATNMVTLTAALPEDPEVGGAVNGLTMSATLAPCGEAKVGAGYRLDWQFSEIVGTASTPGFYSQSVAIVRWVWTPPASAASVRDYISSAFRQKKADDYCKVIAERANTRIDRAVVATGRRPYLYGDSDVWSAAGFAALRLELALEGLIPAGSNTGIFQDQLRRELDGEIRTVISSLQDYDKDNSGTIDAQEAKGLWWSVETTR